MEEINRQLWVTAFPLIAATALPAGGRLLGPLAETLLGDKSMKETPDLNRTKEMEASFLKSIDEHYGIIHKICRIYCRNRADQEDLYQEIVYQLWKTYLSFKGDCKLSTWIYTVAVRSALLPFRRSKVKIEFHDVLPDRPSDEPLDGGVNDRLFVMFHRLEKIDRAILALMMDGFTGKEIGAVVGLGEKAAIMRMSRIRGVIKYAK